jgi:predicted nuclease of restriction endonuclease-like (RecB) superfamily
MVQKICFCFWLFVLSLTLNAGNFVGESHDNKLFSLQIPDDYSIIKSKERKNNKDRWFIFDKKHNYIKSVYHVYIKYYHLTNMSPKTFFKKHKKSLQYLKLPEGKQNKIKRYYLKINKKKGKTTFGQKNWPAYLVFYKNVSRGNFNVIDYYVKVGKHNYVIRGYYSLYSFPGIPQEKRLAKTRERAKDVAQLMNKIKFIH